MKTLWTSNLQDQEDKERFERAVRSARPVFDRLTEILDERLKAIDAIDTGVQKYTQPGWDAIQAHYNGEKASIKYIKNLITLDQKEQQ
jgi:hypothetical protein